MGVVGVRCVSLCFHPVCFLHLFISVDLLSNQMTFSSSFVSSFKFSRLDGFIGMLFRKVSDLDTQRKNFIYVIGKSIFLVFILLFFNISSRSEPQNSSSQVRSTLFSSQISGAAGCWWTRVSSVLAPSLSSECVCRSGWRFMLLFASWILACRFHLFVWSYFDPTKQAGFAASFLHSFSSRRNSRSHLTLSASSHIFFPFFDPLFLSFLDVCLQIDHNDNNPRLRYIQCVQRAER